MATIIFGAGNGNWNTDAAWVGGVKPTAADDAQLTSASGNCTIDAAAVCRSLDCNTYTGVLTHAASTVLTIGDGTAGAGNIALRLVAGMTYTLSNSTTSALSFISTSTTLQTIDFGGKAVGNVTFDGVGGKWAYTSAATGVGTLTLTRGELHTDGSADNSGLTHTFAAFSSNVSNTRVLALGTSTFNITGSSGWVVGATSLTFSTGAATLNMTGASAVLTTGTGLDTSAMSVYMTGSGSVNVTSPSTFTNFSRVGTAVVGDDIRTVALTVTGTLTLSGNSTTNRLLIRGTNFGSVTTLTTTNVPVSSYSDWRDINFNVSRDLSAITGGSGDSGGNGANLTLTTPVTQTWNGTSGGNWSANAWTTRIPLPQDDANISAAFSASQTVTIDMPRPCKSLSMVGATGNPTLTLGLSISIYGSWTLISGMTLSGGFSVSFHGRGTATVTSAGKSFPGAVVIGAFTGSVTLQDAAACLGSVWEVDAGTFDTNGFSLTSTTFNSGVAGNFVRSVLLRSSTVTLTNSGSTWGVSNTGNLTWNAGTSTIAITTTGTVTFTGGGVTYYNLAITGSGANLFTITGANTFNRITVNGGTKSIVLPGSTTTTILSGLGLGNSTNIVTFTASAGSATVAKSSGVLSWDYVSLTNIPSTGGATFYAGPLTHSTDGGGNTGWIFTDAPIVASGTFNTGATTILPMAYGFI